MDTKGIIRTLDFDIDKERLLEKYDSLDPGKRLAVSYILWKAYEGIMQVRELENLYSKAIKGDIPPGTSIDGVFDLLKEDLPERDDLTRAIIRETEEEFEKWPGAFSRYIVVSASNKLKDIWW